MEVNSEFVNWLHLKNNFFDQLFTKPIHNSMMVINDEGIIVAINAAFTKQFGFSQQDVVAKHFAMLFTTEDQKNGLPQKELAEVLTKGSARDDNYMVTKNKEVIWMMGESFLVSNANEKPLVVKLIQNIQLQKEQGISMKQLDSFNEAILSAIKDIILVLDDSLNVVKANKSFYALFNLTEQHMPLQLSALTSIADGSDELLNEVRHTITNKVPFANMLVQVRTLEGDNRVYTTSGSTIAQWNRNAVLLVMQDITLARQLENDREDLIGFVAHELRNPLGNLILCNELIELFLQNNKTADAVKLLQKSKNNVHRLNKMISELYNATKINSGNVTLEISAYNFGEMIEEAIDGVLSLQPAYTITIDGNGNFETQGDKYRMIEVVTNYLTNGIKYSNGNKNIVLRITHTDEFVTVAVIDEGLGIAKEQLPYIFDRYFRAEKTKGLEGIGLGLYLCRRIIQAHKGKVWAESEEGRGSVFYFSVPLQL